jgi:hypothetical protein
MNTAAKVAKLRKMAEDKSLPQDVRNQYLDEAVKLEEKAAKGAGVKMAKGGVVPNTPRDMMSQMQQQKAMKAAKPNMASSSAAASPLPAMSMPQTKAAPKRVAAQPSAAASKPITNELILAQMKNAKQPAANKPMMAKGGAVKKPAGKTMMAKGGAVKKAKK